jgi:hypothetical protein
MLAPKLYEMRRKGYPWRDVAAWLSGNGLSMSAAALQRHLRDVKDVAVRGGSRGRGKGSGDGNPDVSAAPAMSNLEATAPTAAPPKVAPPPVEPKARDVEPPKGASNFTVRPDRKII